MQNIFSFSSVKLAQPLLIAALGACALVLLLALRSPYLARIGWRSVGRRRTRTALIVFGLMLSTMFVAAALAVDDTITTAVRTVAVFNLGRIDEDIAGGDGPLHLFPAAYAGPVTQLLTSDPHVAGVAPALTVPNLLVADESARQVRGGVTGFALAGDRTGPLGNLQAANGSAAPAGNLGSRDVYLNRSTGALLNARPGDALYLYSTLWPGHRYRFTVSAIVTGGPLGDAPAVVLPLATLQQLTSAQDEINHIYVANAGDGLTGVGYSDEITSVAYAALQGNLRVDEVKQDGVQLALRAQDIFGRILTLYTSFALALGLLLIFLIFVLLAAERRAELGMARALGMRRGHVVGMLLLEGATYDGVAAALGILSGLGLGLLVVKLVSPTLTQIGFPLQISVQTQSVVVAFCLGLVFTLATIWLAAWTVSRMTVAAALRDLPEPPSPAPSLFGLARALVVALSRVFISPLLLPTAALRLAWGLTARGLVPLIVGRWLLDRATEREDVLLLSLGVSCLLAGAVLLLRWLALTTVSAVARATRPRQALHTLVRATIVADRLSALCVGGGLALYWSLPYDSLVAIGLRRFTGGVETFFVAGVMMVFGAVWALAPNLDLLLAPVRWLLSRIGRSRHVARMALVYPSQHRFRTGVGLALFSLVCFTMVTMACIAASTTANYDNVPVQAAGYDVAGQPLFAPVGGSARLSAALHGSSGADGLSAVSSATPLPLGILQPGAPNARWSIYPVSQVDGAFLDGVGLPLVARASGYASDNAVWQAVGHRSGYVVVDAGALSGADATALGLTAPPGLTPSQLVGPPIASGLPGLASLESLAADPPGGGESASTQAFPLPIGDFSLGELQLKLRNVAVGQGTIAPTPIWVADARGGPAVKLTIIGVVQDVHGERRGLFGSAGTFAPVEQDLTPFGNEYYYFKVHPGVDAHEEALSLGSTLLNFGFETTVLQDVLLDVNGPRVFISRVLVGLVGLTLLVGMAALAVSGSRSVVERRQQIGMLRALGFHRGHVQALFVAESLLVGAAGTAVGLFFGLILCQNMFAVDFFERFQSGLSLVVPWQELAVICAAALSASALASLLPAWQAGRIAPADALRYE